MTLSTRVLIIGATGCAGTHLSELALAHGARVFGFAQTGTFAPRVTGYIGNITRPAEVEAVIAEAKPDQIFHLAAIIPGAPTISPETYLHVNINGTYHILEAARRLAPAARLLVASSSGIYGQPANAEQLITEDFPLQPQSLYAVSKAAQDLLAAQFCQEHGLHTIRGRTFNQTGPREPAGLVCATLARQIARIEAGLQEPTLCVLTLQPRRDFLDVRDVVRGYWAALEHGAAGQAYNICSGQACSIGKIVEILLGLSSARHVRVHETAPASAARGITSQAGDATRLRACSTWQPLIPLEQSLHDLLEEWRARGREEQ